MMRGAPTVSSFFLCHNSSVQNTSRNDAESTGMREPLVSRCKCIIYITITPDCE